ncbi:hypothetical protein WN48_09966 [Eufriesea mexicana]|uniref:Uncharacterized protein n=1 Tax=Eufriesea mexicana TaxID=516756 RepID=A0A310SDU8_9HYME|nr:hypothetical protein WN48_09966 [Eufriesea mexicana]
MLWVTCKLLRIQWSISQIVYLNILKENLKQSTKVLWVMGILDNFHFYQDNDPKHKYEQSSARMIVIQLSENNENSITVLGFKSYRDDMEHIIYVIGWIVLMLSPVPLLLANIVSEYLLNVVRHFICLFFKPLLG